MPEPDAPVPAEETPVHPAPPADDPQATAEQLATEPEPADGAAALQRHRAAALALATFAPSNCGPALAARNAKRGVAAVLALKAEPNANLPAKPDWTAVGKVEDLGKAFWHAHGLAERATAAPQEPFEVLSARVHAGRKLVLSALGLLVSQGKLDSAAYTAITAGRGVLDACADVTAGAQRLQAAGEVGLVGELRLAAAVADAEALQARVRPGSVRGGFGKTGNVADAAELRDRVFTLLVAAYKEARRIGMCNWVDEVDAHVPSLLARRE